MLISWLMSIIRCIWVTMNCGTCFLNSRKSERNARCHHHLQQPYHRGDLQPRLAAHLAEVLTVISEALEMNSVIATEGTNDMAPPVTSE